MLYFYIKFRITEYPSYNAQEPGRFITQHLHLLGYPVTAALLRDTIKGTLVYFMDLL
jgi:hypothetical protein